MSKVAVVTRTKNRPTFLQRAIKSVSSQEYKDYIHVIINDGGDIDIIESIINDQPLAVRNKIRLFHRNVSSNAPDTIFNESIDRVDSDFFAIHDDDDTWHSEFLLKTVSFLDENSEIGAVVVRTDKVIEKNMKLKKKTQWMSDVKGVSLYRQYIDNQLTPISTLYRRSAYESVGKFETRFPVLADWEFGIRLLIKYEVGFIDPGYALARYHHRIKRVGTDVDSISTSDKHRYYTGIILNEYLRRDLSEGRFGSGYVMNDLRFRHTKAVENVRRLTPKFMYNILKRKFNG